MSRPKPSINRSSCPHAIPNKRDPWPTQPRPSLEIRYPRQKNTCTSSMERSITFNLSSARDTPRYSFQFCRLGPLGSGGPSRRRRIPAFPRNLPLEECRIAPTPPSAAPRTEQPEWGKFPACSVCRPGRTDADGRTGVAEGEVRWIGRYKLRRVIRRRDTRFSRGVRPGYRGMIGPLCAAIRPPIFQRMWGKKERVLQQVRLQMHGD